MLRTNYSLRTWVAEIGGFFEVLKVIFYLVTLFWSRHLFMNKVLGLMFLVKNNSQKAIIRMDSFRSTDTATNAGHALKDRIDENLKRHELSFCN
jgi:hypothetical protein